MQAFEAGFEAREALACFLGGVRSGGFRAGHGRFSALSVLAAVASLSSKGPLGNAGRATPLAVTTSAPRTLPALAAAPAAGGKPSSSHKVSGPDDSGAGATDASPSAAAWRTASEPSRSRASRRLRS